mmetsp:Transcript_18414/g.41654  ORF Transcript_18414/g.41654 Transcript_18414/m.41654 type:complete len:167 (+) Transcript_18414:83-583(+)
MSSLYGVNLYAKNRMPDGSGRDLMILLDSGYRMGRDQLGFGSIPRAPVSAQHPLFHKTELKSVKNVDPDWTDVYGKRPNKPAPPARDPGSGGPHGSGTLCRMKGGNVLYLLPKKEPPASTRRSASLPSIGSHGEGRRAWHTRETFTSYDCWSNKVPGAVSSTRRCA